MKCGNSIPAIKEANLCHSRADPAPVWGLGRGGHPGSCRMPDQVRHDTAGCNYRHAKKNSMLIVLAAALSILLCTAMVQAAAYFTTKGGVSVIPVFADTGAADTAMGTPVQGALIYSTSDGGIMYYDGSAWIFVDDFSGLLDDNIIDAWDIQEGTNNYINIDTTDGSEAVTFGNATTNPDFSFLGSGNITTAGDVAVNGGDITTTAVTANVVNTSATTVNIAGASTATTIGSATGTTTIGNDLAVTNNATVIGDLTVTGDDITMATNTAGAVLVGDGTNFNPVVASGDAAIAADGTVTVTDNAVDGTDIAMGSDVQGDILFYDGTDYIRLPAGTSGQVLQTQGNAANPVWTNATVDTNLGANDQTLSGARTVTMAGNDLTLDGTGDIVLADSGDINAAGDVAVDGGDITTTSTTANVFNTNATAVNIAGASTVTAIGSGSGTTTIGNDLSLNGTNLVLDADGAATTTLSSNASSSYTLTLPTDDGTANQVLSTDGSGNLGWVNGLTDTLASANIFVGNGSNVVTGVAMSGDVTIDNTGATTVQADAVALAIDTTGSYVATIADAGNAAITVANSGTENASITLDIADGGVVEDDLAASLAFDDGDLLDLSAVDAGGTAEGLILPQAADVSAATAEGQITWDTDDDTLYVGDGTTAQAIPTRNIYSGDGTLAGARTITTGGNNLTIDGTEDIVLADSGDITTAGDVAVNGGDLTTTSTTANVVNTNATTVNIAGASTATSIGAATGTTTIGSDLAVTNNATVTGDLTVTGDNITMTTNTAGALLVADGTNFNPVVASGDAAIAADGTVTVTDNAVDGTDIAMGSDAQGDILFYDGTDYIRLPAGTSGQVLQTQGNAADPVWANATVDTNLGSNDLTLSGARTITMSGNDLTMDGTGDIVLADSGNITTAGDVAVNGGDITTTSSTANIVNTNATTVNIAGASTATSIGAATGTTTIGNDAAITGDATVTGGDVTVGSGNVAKAGSVVLHDADVGDSFTTTLASNADVGASFTLTLPADDGNANEVLTTDGSGALSWADANGVADGTSANNTLRWDGSNWVESTVLTNDGTDVAASGNITATGDVAVNGGDITTTSVTANVVNANATTVNIAGASTATAIGAAAGTTTIGNDLTVTNDATIAGDATVNGADLTLGDGTTAAAGSIVLHDADTGDSFTTTLASNADVAADFTLTLPADAGTANQVLSTDGSGNLGWVNGLTDTLASANIFVGNGSNIATGVAMSGDIAIDNTGATTIQGDAVALATDTTGNYVATIADAGNTVITVTNSGSENAAVTLDITDGGVVEDDLAASLAFDDGDLVDLSGVDASSTSEGIILPQAADVSAATAEGQITWDTDDDTLYVGDGTTAQAIPTENIYSGNGTLAGARTITMSGNDLTMDGTGDIVLADSGNITTAGDLAVNGGDITTTAGTANVVNTNATTVNIAGASTATAIGSTTGTTTIGNDLAATGDMDVQGGDITNTTGALTISPNAGTNLNVSLSTTGDMVVNTDDLVVDTSAGFVGIGDTTPDGRLEVRNSGTEDILNLYDGSTNVLSVLDGGDLWVDTDTLYVDASADRVGINDSTPDAALDVEGGDFWLNTGAGDVYFEANTNDRDDGTGVTVRASSNPTNGAIFSVRSSGQANRFWVGQSITSSGVNDFYVDFTGTTGDEHDTSGYSTKIGGTSDTYFGGDVGIGTNNPSAPLHVNGNANIDGDLTTSQTTFNLLNTTATTLNIGGAATTVNIGASTGTTTFPGNVQIDGDLTGPRSVYLIWAEEAAALNNNRTEWAFGNGDNTPSGDGIVIAYDSELEKISYNLEGTISGAEIAVLKNGTQEATTGSISTNDGVVTLGSTVSFAEGDVLNFRTIASGGATTGRIAAWMLSNFQ